MTVAIRQMHVPPSGLLIINRYFQFKSSQSVVIKTIIFKSSIVNMKSICLFSCLALLLGCGDRASEKSKSTTSDSSFGKFIDNYYHQRMAIFPLESTMN